MTVNIALFLSSDSIALAHRQTAGHWAMIGETALDVPDLSAALSGLRSLAVERVGEDFEVLLVLPDDQILYTSLTAPTADPELTAFRIEEGLDGLTPYSVTELEYDWRVLEEDRVKIAVVARETLDEARGFAAQYGFEGRGFAAMPPMERFPGVPTFDLGDVVAEMGFTAEGIAFGPDSFGVPEPDPEPEVVEAPAEVSGVAAVTAEVEAEVEPDVEAVPDVVSDVVSEPVSEIKPEALAPVARSTAPDPEPEVTPAPVAKPEPDLEDQNPALAEALMVAAQAAEDLEVAEAEAASGGGADGDGAGGDGAGGDGAGGGATEEGGAAGVDEAKIDAPPTPVIPVQAIEDPSLSGPISPIAGGDADTPIPVVGNAGDSDDLLPPQPSPASLEARERARVIRGETTRKPAPAPEAAGTDTGTDTAKFTARRGHAAAPDTGRESLVGQRGSRIGLTHPDGPPRAAPSTVQPAAPATGQTSESDAADAPMPRLAEQLQRVRNASKTRPQSATGAQVDPPRPRVEIEPQPPLGTTGVTAERRPTPFDGPAPKPANADGRKGLLGGMGRGSGGETGPKSGRIPAPVSGPDTAPVSGPDSGPDSGAKVTKDVTADPKTAAPKPARGGFLRSKGARAAAAAAANPIDAAAASDRTFTSGLLARKSVAPAGGSFKTGLVLTLILLLLLALVAIWSAIFLPNSPVARLLGIGDTVEEVAAAGTGLQAPDVTTIAPIIGTSDAIQPTSEDEAAADGMILPDEGGTPDISGVAALEAVDDRPFEVAVNVTTPGTESDLPGIDADLDLPPLPPIDQGQNPTLEEAAALYAEDGIWARSPDRPDLRPFDLLDRVYTASIDPEVRAFDAIALPDPGVNPGELLRRFPPPPAFGAEFDITATGLVTPTPEGILTPEGAFVIAGTPPLESRPRPREIASAAPAIDTDAAILSTFRPTPRPGDLSETRERQILNGLTESELGERRPASRPPSPQETAAQASLFPGNRAGADPDAVDAAVREAIAGTNPAVARSLLPRTRPGNIEQIVASADRTPIEAATTVAVAVEAVAAGPAIPSNADVSRAATQRNAIHLRNVNLIGVAGSPSERRALVRLSSGRFVRVGVGDRLDGGRVAAVGETTLQYVRRGRTVTLEIPG